MHSTIRAPSSVPVSLGYVNDARVKLDQMRIGVIETFGCDHAQLINKPNTPSCASLMSCFDSFQRKLDNRAAAPPCSLTEGSCWGDRLNESKCTHLSVAFGHHLLFGRCVGGSRLGSADAGAALDQLSTLDVAPRLSPL